MKIIVVGANGTLGAPVYQALAVRHEVVPVSATKSDIKVDITDSTSIKVMFEAVGPLDALVVTAGGAHVGPLQEMTEADVYKGIRSKLMGQVNLALTGQHYIRDGGSFTLTSGILSVDPIRDGTVLSLVNNAINGFVLGAAARSAVCPPRPFRYGVVAALRSARPDPSGTGSSLRSDLPSARPYNCSAAAARS